MISSYCFMTPAASSGFSTLSAFFFNSSVLFSVISLLIMESISCFLISSLLIRLLFLVFSETFCSYKQKNNHYTTNLKHPPQTKNAMHNLILRLSQVPLNAISLY